jgi:hypothetical protein
VGHWCYNYALPTLKTGRTLPKLKPELQVKKHHAFWSSVGSALLEDALQLDRCPTQRMKRYLQRFDGRPLPAKVRQVSHKVFKRRAEDVMVHVGPRSDDLLVQAQAPACCFRHHVLLASWALTTPDQAARLLLHELTHYGTTGPIDGVRCWDAGEHALISAEACTAYQADLDSLVTSVDLVWEQFLRGIQNASSNMDFRGRVTYLGTTLKYLSGISKGEGPAHGEGRNYTSPSMATNEALNLREQTRFIQSAVEHFLQDEPLAVGPLHIRPPTQRSGPMGDTLGGISLLEREWIKSLGGALHIAQDRAAHREGTQGHGHDDPRCADRGWNPDKRRHDHSLGKGWERCNEAARNKALNNSFDAVYDFLKGVYQRQDNAARLARVPRLPETCP